MHCAGCNKPLGTHDDESCHIRFDAPKSYSQYLDEAIVTNESIMNKYGAPPDARVPGTKTLWIPLTTQKQFRNVDGNT